MQPENKRLLSCPSEELLLNYRRGELSSEQHQAISSHLLFCDTCLEYLKLLAPDNYAEFTTDTDSQVDTNLRPAFESSLAKTIDRFRFLQQQRHVTPKLREVFQREGRKFQVGQIWRPKSQAIVLPDVDDGVFSVTDLDSRPHLVVITNAMVLEEELGDAKYHVVRVAPLDADFDCVNDDDLLIREGDSPLGYSFLIQAWNEQEMLVENLECWLVEFNTKEHGAILERLESIGERELADGAFSLEAVIMKGHYPDPVMRYRAREYEDTAYLRMPVESLRSSRVANSSFDDLPEYSDQEDYRLANQQIADEPDLISTILQVAGITDAVWSGGWKRYAASASEGVRQPQVIWNSDKSLSATLEPMGKRMLLRIESHDKRWEGALVPFSWKSVADDVSESRCVFAILAKDEVKRGSYVAEIKLGELDEIEGTSMPDNPFPLEKFQPRVFLFVRESIKRSRTNHELDAWKELSEREGLDLKMRKIIRDELTGDEASR
jgi:hypothetical protein